MSTIHELAKQMSEAFETRKRTSNNENFVALKDNSPEWMTDIIRQVHADDGDQLPNDITYSMISEAVSAISEQSPDACPHDAAADLVEESYSKDLYKWAESHNMSDTYLDDALEMFGSIKSHFELMQYANSTHKTDVLSMVVSALEKIATDDDDDDDDDDNA